MQLTIITSKSIVRSVQNYRYYILKRHSWNYYNKIKQNFDVFLIKLANIFYYFIKMHYISASDCYRTVFYKLFKLQTIY